MNPVSFTHLKTLSCSRDAIIDWVVSESHLGWKLLRQEDLENGKVMLVFTRFRAALIAEAKSDLETEFARPVLDLFFVMDDSDIDSNGT